MMHASIAAMLLGTATLIFLLSAIDSSHLYQTIRARSESFRDAVNMGIRLRIYLALYIWLSWGLFYPSPAHSLGIVLAFPITAELAIGMAAHWLCVAMFGYSFANFPSEGYAANIPITALQNFLATYTVTLLTGIIHSVILLLICALVYVAKKLRDKIPTI